MLQKQAKNEATFRVPDQAGWQPTSQAITDRVGIDSHNRTDLPVDVCCGEPTMHRIKRIVLCVFYVGLSSHVCPDSQSWSGQHMWRP